MNLNEFRQRIEANQPSTEDGIEWVVALTAAEAQWLLEGIEKDITILDDDRFCSCHGQIWEMAIYPKSDDDVGTTKSIYIHAPDCPRQLALKHWEGNW